MPYGTIFHLADLDLVWKKLSLALTSVRHILADVNHCVRACGGEGMTLKVNNHKVNNKCGFIEVLMF